MKPKTGIEKILWRLSIAIAVGILAWLWVMLSATPAIALLGMSYP